MKLNVAFLLVAATVAPAAGGKPGCGGSLNEIGTSCEKTFNSELGVRCQTPCTQGSGHCPRPCATKPGQHRIGKCLQGKFEDLMGGRKCGKGTLKESGKYCMQRCNKMVPDAGKHCLANCLELKYYEDDLAPADKQAVKVAPWERSQTMEKMEMKEKKDNADANAPAANNKQAVEVAPVEHSQTMEKMEMKEKKEKKEKMEKKDNADANHFQTMEKKEKKDNTVTNSPAENDKQAVEVAPWEHSQTMEKMEMKEKMEKKDSVDANHSQTMEKMEEMEKKEKTEKKDNADANPPAAKWPKAKDEGPEDEAKRPWAESNHKAAHKAKDEGPEDQAEKSNCWGWSCVMLDWYDYWFRIK